MKFNKLLIIIVLAGALVGLFLVSRADKGQMVSPQVASQNATAVTPTPAPSLVPVTFDKNSNLEGETEKLIPDDFSGDFNLLKEEVGKL